MLVVLRFGTNMKNIFIILLIFCLTQFTMAQSQIPLKGTRTAKENNWFQLHSRSLKVKDLPTKQAILWPAEGGQVSRIITNLNKPVKATHLNFVQTFHPGQRLFDWMAAVGLAHRKIQLPPATPTVVTYEVIYEDSSTVDIPVRYEESIHSWYRIHEAGPMLWAEPEIIRNYDQSSGEKAVIYNMKWPNPKPGESIIGIRIKGNDSGKLAYGKLLLMSVDIIQEEFPGHTFYVDLKPAGSDNNSGSFDQPFSSLQHAVVVARPGDKIYIRGGYYALDAPVNINFEGEKDKWLTISSYFGETPVLESYGVPAEYRDSKGIISASGDPSYLRIQGLHIYNSRRAGISVYGKSKQGSNWGETEHVDVRFNTTYKSVTMGIIIHTVNNVKVIGNKVIRPHSIQMSTDPGTGEVTSFDHGAQEAIDLSRNKGFVIAYNEVYGGSKEAVDCISVEDGEIHHNYIHDCLNGIYIDSWSVPIRNLNIHHNFIHNAFNGIPLATEGSNDLYNFDIHHNIIINSKSCGIAINEATYKAKPAKVQKIRVYNNTVHRSGGHASAIGWQASGIEVGGFEDNENFRDVDVENNIVTYTKGRPLANIYAGKPSHDIVFTNNLVFPKGDNTPEWMLSDKKKKVNNYNILGSKPVIADPLYKCPSRGDFRLKNNSPAKDAGTTGNDLGALSGGAGWFAGLDWSGKITAYYYDEIIWEPVMIPPKKFNMHRNHLQRPSWFQRNRYGVDFQNLPSGEQSFAGTTFFIPDESQLTTPTVMALSGKTAELEVNQIKNIPVNRKAKNLAFLQAYHLNNNNIKKGEQLFHYRVHYVDGSYADIPVKWAVHIEDWLSGPDQLHNLEKASLAWNQAVLKKRGGSQQIRLYNMEWENPKPDIEIESIDIFNDMEYQDGAPAIFAISTGT